MKPFRFLGIAILIIFLAGCSSNHITDSFLGLGGQKYWTVQAAPGQTLHVVYKAVVTKGSLKLQVISPSRKVLWAVKGDTKGMQTKDIPITVKGGFDLMVTASAADGSYDLQYSIIQPTSNTKPTPTR